MEASNLSVPNPAQDSGGQSSGGQNIVGKPFPYTTDEIDRMVDEAHRAFHERMDATGGDPVLPPLDSPDRFPLVDLARALKVDPRRLQERAKKLNILIERRYIQDANGHRQRTLTTDAPGIEMLKRWYSK